MNGGAALIAQKPAGIGRQGVEQGLRRARGPGDHFEVITKDNLSEMQDVLYEPSC